MDSHNTELVVSATGDLDMSSAGELGDRLTAAIRTSEPGARIVVDLADVSFCDSQGIRALMLAHQLAEASGRSFTIRGVTGNVEQVLRIAGVLDLLTLTA